MPGNLSIDNTNSISSFKGMMYIFFLFFHGLVRKRLPSINIHRRVVRGITSTPEFRFIQFEFEGYCDHRTKDTNDIRRHVPEYSLNMEIRVSRSPFCSRTGKQASLLLELADLLLSPLWGTRSNLSAYVKLMVADCLRFSL